MTLVSFCTSHLEIDGVTEQLHLPIDLNSTLMKERAMQNIVFVWVDANMDENDFDPQYTPERLRAILNDIILFQESDQCVKSQHGAGTTDIHLFLRK